MESESIEPRRSFLLLTYDSCRFDVLSAARTPVLDAFTPPVPAQAPANFTYPSHQAFFVGILPNATESAPYYNRFTKQLLGLNDVGEGQVVKESLQRVDSPWNVVRGLRDRGYQTIGAGAMNWFRQESLTAGFETFSFTGTDGRRQVEFLRRELDTDRPFFGFVNFGETHAPYRYEGKQDRCPVDVRARRMTWPPRPGAGPVGADNPGFEHQMRAAEFLDSRLEELLEFVPADTIVVLTADHGECFGEDGYWGHGINHPKVLEVPLAIFRADGRPLEGS